MSIKVLCDCCETLGDLRLSKRLEYELPCYQLPEGWENMAGRDLCSGCLFAAKKVLAYQCLKEANK